MRCTARIGAVVSLIVSRDRGLMIRLSVKKNELLSAVRNLSSKQVALVKYALGCS